MLQWVHAMISVVDVINMVIKLIFKVRNVKTGISMAIIVDAMVSNVIRSNARICTQVEHGMGALISRQRSVFLPLLENLSCMAVKCCASKDFRP